MIARSGSFPRAGLRGRAVVLLVAGLTAAPVVFAPAGPAAAAQSAAPASRGYTLTGAEAVIHDLIGEVEVIRGDGPDIRVEVTTGGADAGQLRVETGRTGDASWLRVIFPGDRFVYPALGRGSRTECRVRDDGTFNGSLGGGRRVRISGSGEGLEVHANLRVAVPDGARLKLHTGVGEVAITRVNGRFVIDTMSASVAAGNVRGQLDIDVGSGNVDVTGMDGELVIDTGSGDVTLAGVRGLHASVDTGSGRVSGSDVAASSVDVDTGSGDIEITRLATRTARFDTGSGEVRLDLTEDVDTVDIDTGSGDVRIGVPPVLGAGLHIETGSGGIDIAVPHQTRHLGDSEFDGTIGDGGGRIVIETGSGDVRVVAG